MRKSQPIIVSDVTLADYALYQAAGVQNVLGIGLLLRESLQFESISQFQTNFF